VADLPIILLPGLNGDARVFQRQAEAFPGLKIAQWAQPVPYETLNAYAERMARLLDPGVPCLIGGVSFGGIVALEAAGHLQARACVLIASTRDVRGLPTPVRLLRPFASVMSPTALRWSVGAGSESVAVVTPRVARRFALLAPRERTFRLWALRALLTWAPSAMDRCQIFQIHGECDTTFAAGRSRADRIVAHAGHLMTLTHAREVNKFLLATLQSCGSSVQSCDWRLETESNDAVSG
jgi:pimeloyl-ACP methyl ester carboxylesterase